MSVRYNLRSRTDLVRPIPGADAVLIHDQSCLEQWDQYVEFIEEQTREYDGIFHTQSYRILQNGLQLVANWLKYSNGGESSYADYAHVENRDLWGRPLEGGDEASQLGDRGASSVDERSMNEGQPDTEEYEPFEGGPRRYSDGEGKFSPKESDYNVSSHGRNYEVESFGM